MAVSLGKRKSRDHGEDHDGLEDDEAMRARFRRAFEAKFKPLASTTPKPQPVVPLEEQDDSEETDWSGCSDDEKEVEIIEHTALDHEDDEAASKAEAKVFMSSKPPSTTNRPTPKPPRPEPSSNNEEAALLQNDLALHRLLQESHLLDGTHFSPSTTTSGRSSGTSSEPQGKARLAAQTLRLRALGAKPATLATQTKMPMAQRKGIAAKAADRESRRRQEARENGVVLERVTASAQTGPTAGPAKRRVRGIGGPTVGKFTKGTLRLSRRDVREIEGPRERGGGGGGRGRGGRQQRRR